MYGITSSRKRVASLALALLIVGTSLLVLGPVAKGGSQVSHTPIAIMGDSGFTAANGVTAGSGTALDPYVISGWSISQSLVTGALGIMKTRAHFVVRNVTVYGGADAIVLSNVTNARLENLAASGGANGSTGQGAAIRVSNSTSVSIVGVTVQSGSDPYKGGGGPGIVVGSSANIVISNNNLPYVSNDGMDILNDANMTIVGNTVGPSQDGYGMQVSGSNITLSGNKFQHSGLVLGGDATVTPDNTVNGNPLYYFNGCGGSGLTLDRVPVGELIIDHCSNVRLSNLNVTATDVGIRMNDVHHVLINNTSLFGETHDGIYLSSSSDVTIEHNRFNLTLNYFEGPGAWPDLLIDHSNNTIVDGNLFDQGYGTAIQAQHLVNANITGNTFSNNVGLIYWGGTGTNIQIYHNNFYITKGFTFLGLTDSQPRHFWDNGYPSGGNYWSNYTGVDKCSGPMQNICTGPDGIGDTPYFIPGGVNQDHYPLMQPFVASVDPPASTGGGMGGQPPRRA